MDVADKIYRMHKQKLWTNTLHWIVSSLVDKESMPFHTVDSDNRLESGGLLTRDWQLNIHPNIFKENVNSTRPCDTKQKKN